MTVQKTEAPKGDKKLYDVEATEMSKVNKRAFFGGDEGPTITTYFQMPFPRTDFVPSMGRLHKQRKFRVVFNSGNAFIIKRCTVVILPQIQLDSSDASARLTSQKAL